MSENEAWKLIIEKTGIKSKEEQNYKLLYPNQYRPKEQTNSLPPSRQILDTIYLKSKNCFATNAVFF